MTKRFLLITLILVISTALIACGKKYDKEIEEVSKLENKSSKESQLKDTLEFKRDKSNIYVYNEGKVIALTYKSLKDSDTLWTSLYRKNETTGKYEEDYNAKPKKFMKENKPDYKEENLKE
ncbi:MULTISPECIES: cystatin-like fold lipoprotein [Staphylococcus]|uniref:cystatin-like fold lipoprotein n=1 Tax=Staphylococcus TaxID=1279 RepID=UPI00194FDD12|nr:MULTISPECIES: cystatin-like fold lipoprotein [Staphylococcus]UMT78659.1 DUF4467 domain-containing protein [Staphylococcus roterodami]MCS5315202.1 DUF4467 domain-containing protein [Staphylococcus aureus]MCS5319858.1 DUF4467 domain-containing protein [Staphylococcus aureus]MCS5323916.1 DUF4467 domain-containing protein [Staphylococcus aureus]MCS5328661.1 DUF4467 domain-containing protein [Staphylococcus aureus]